MNRTFIANLSHLDQIVPLFEAYRQFYGNPADLESSKTFIENRLRNQESVIFLHQTEAGSSVGFAQLYPSFSSVSAARIYILNDLFVSPVARRQGVASTLIKAATHFARSVGAIRLTLSTANSNKTAQSLYEREGWIRESNFCNYNLSLSKES
ncbi:MAG: GNAT family N-acetyltransferase [Verrucomicrobiota bacterium]